MGGSTCNVLPIVVLDQHQIFKGFHKLAGDGDFISALIDLRGSGIAIYFKLFIFYSC